VPAGEVGDLYVRGETAALCYWRKYLVSRRAFQGEWLRTGDKYRADADGYYWFAGRADDMLKVGGIWVSPTEVENGLMFHPAVEQCAVVGRQDGSGLTKPMAYVVLRAGYEPAPELGQELIEFATQKMAAYKRPRWLEFVAALPKTATGKIQRFRLRAGAA
jgi:acyl-coenzyme A synthetase/AMP-(fatty) acid ligase